MFTGLPLSLHYIFIPVILVALGAYFVADIFLQIYEMGIDTIFYCFLEDLESNDGTPEKPYFMPHKLQEIVEKFNRLTQRDRTK